MKKKFIQMIFAVAMILTLGGCVSFFPPELTEDSCRDFLNPDIVVNPENFAENSMKIPLYLVGSTKDPEDRKLVFTLNKVFPVSDFLIILEYERKGGSPEDYALRKKEGKLVSQGGTSRDYEWKKKEGRFMWKLINLKTKELTSLETLAAEKLKMSITPIRNFREPALPNGNSMVDYIEELSFWGGQVTGTEYDVISGNGQRSVHIRNFDNKQYSADSHRRTFLVEHYFYIMLNDNDIIELFTTDDNTNEYGSYDFSKLVTLKTPVEGTQISNNGKYVGFGSYLFNVETNSSYIYALGYLLFTQVHPGLKKATIIYRVIENHDYTTYISTIDIRLPE